MSIELSLQALRRQGFVAKLDEENQILKFTYESKEDQRSAKELSNIAKQHHQLSNQLDQMNISIDTACKINDLVATDQLITLIKAI